MMVMDVADAHAALTDDLGTYEAAVREAEDTARRSGQFSAHLAARVQRQRADLLHARAEVEIAAAAAGTPGKAERARATITEALDRLEAARLAGSPPNADWHLWRSGLLTQRAMLEELAMPDAAPDTHDLAVAEARAAIVSARREPPIHRALGAANASVVYQAAVTGGADPALLDEAIGHIERAMRHRLDSGIRGRLQAQRASLLADRKTARAHGIGHWWVSCGALSNRSRPHRMAGSHMHAAGPMPRRTLGSQPKRPKRIHGGSV
jgi:hypothetical protein